MGERDRSEGEICLGTRGSKRDSVSPKRRKQERGRKKRRTTSSGATCVERIFGNKNICKQSSAYRSKRPTDREVVIYVLIFASNQNYVHERERISPTLLSSIKGVRA